MNRNDRDYLIQKIRTRYTEKEYDELDALKNLDKKVNAPAHIFTYVFGSVSALIMGTGMSLIMTDIGTTVGLTDPMIPGLVLGIVGMLMAIVNYPIYKGILGSRRKKYAGKIMELSDQLMRG